MYYLSTLLLKWINTHSTPTSVSLDDYSEPFSFSLLSNYLIQAKTTRKVPSYSAFLDFSRAERLIKCISAFP